MRSAAAARSWTNAPMANATEDESMSETIFHKIIRREIPADIVFED